MSLIMILNLQETENIGQIIKKYLKAHREIDM